MVLLVNRDSALCGISKSEVRIPQVFTWAMCTAFPPILPKVAFSGNAWKLPKRMWSHWEIDSIHRRNVDGCNEFSSVTAMICSIKMIHTPNNLPVSTVYSFLRFSLGCWPLSGLTFPQRDLLFFHMQIKEKNKKIHTTVNENINSYLRK